MRSFEFEKIRNSFRIERTQILIMEMTMLFGWTCKFCFTIVFLLAFFACQSTEKPELMADLILTNGNIITVDNSTPKVEAVAVKGDRILDVGSDADMIIYKDDQTKIIDLDGRTTVPGLIDAHMHFPLLGKRLKQIYLDEAKSFSEVLEYVEIAVKNAEAGEWIMGSGWHTANWKNKEYPDNRQLNDISPDNPVFLSGMAIHAALVNDRVLELAGIDANTRDPEGGHIVRYPGTQNPTGLLLEKAQALATRVFPPETDAVKKENILLSVKTALKLGLTSVHDPGVDPDMVRLYKDLLEEKLLDTRLYVMLLIQGDGPVLDSYLSDEPEIGLGKNFLTVRCIKFLIDGAMGARGAAMLFSYSDMPQHTGLIAIPEDEVYSILKKCLASGYQVAMHAIGDRGNRIGLDAAERALNEVPVSDARIRIEHAQILAPADLPRFVGLRIIPSMQPIHCSMDKDFAEARVGKERIKGAYAWRSLLDSGVRIAGGSDVPDFPVAYTNPLWGIYSAVTRQDLEGKPVDGWYPEQRVSRLEALKMYTIDAAYAAFEEDLKGSIAPGKLADFTVLSKDILTVPVDEILQTEVEMTIVGGLVKYDKFEAPKR
jgi:predicted amidohydrolase YtcJ